jgi:hypothetical protein
MKFLQLRQSRRGLMLIWRTQSKKINSSSNVGLTRTSVVVAEGAILMPAVDVEAEVAGIRMVVAVAGIRMVVAVAVGTRMAVVEAVGTRMAVAEVVVGTRMAVEAADSTMIVDTTSREAITAEAGVVALVAILTTTIMVEARREVVMDILEGWSWVPTLSFLTILSGVRGAILLL